MPQIDLLLAAELLVVLLLMVAMDASCRSSATKLFPSRRTIITG